jgi:hypothetical protein
MEYEFEVADTSDVHARAQMNRHASPFHWSSHVCTRSVVGNARHRGIVGCVMTCGRKG